MSSAPHYWSGYQERRRTRQILKTSIGLQDTCLICNLSIASSKRQGLVGGVGSISHKGKSDTSAGTEGSKGPRSSSCSMTSSQISLSPSQDHTPLHGPCVGRGVLPKLIFTFLPSSVALPVTLSAYYIVLGSSALQLQVIKVINAVMLPRRLPDPHAFLETGY